jgi:hypothetical protein
VALIPSKSGRRYSDRRRSPEPEPLSSPSDPRTELPLSERDYIQETLADGTVLTTYCDPPLGADDPLALVELPEEIEPEAPQTWRADKPLPPNDELERWTGPVGPLPRREPEGEA